MRSVLLALALSVSGFSVISAQSGVAGDWTVAFNTPGGTREAAMAMKVSGDAVTGTLASEMGEIAFKGTTKGNTFNLNFDVQTPNGTFSIAMTGEVTGDEMKGTVDYGQGTGDFTGKRKN